MSIIENPAKTLGRTNPPSATIPAPFTSLKDISEPSRTPSWTRFVKDDPDNPDTPAHLVVGHSTSVRVLDYGNGYLEASVGLVLPPKRRSQSDAPPRAKSTEEKAANWERATRRARQSVRRLVMANGFDRILTLTTRANIDEAKAFWAMWKRFLRLARDVGFEMPYVAVLEYQKRGAAHIHAAVRGHYPHADLRALWLRVIEESVPANHPSLARDDGFAPNDGSVQLEYRSDTNPARLASYLSKYLTKQAAADLDGAHRYRAAIGLKRPTVSRHYITETEDLDAVAEDALRQAGAAGCVAVAGDFHGWACNWDRRGDIITESGPSSGKDGASQVPRRKIRIS